MANHLFLPTDLSSSSIEHLGDLGWFYQQGARQITLFHAYEVGHPTGTAPKTDDYFLPLLKAAALPLQDQGFEVSFQTAAGRPATEILKGAHRVGADLILLTNRGRSALEEVLVGSTATALMEISDLPVFLYSLGAEEPPGIEGTIIHPTDFSTASQKAFDWILSDAHAEGYPTKRLLLVHIIGDSRGDDVLEPEEARKLIVPLREKALAANLEVETQVVKGRPKKALAELLRNHPEALLAMGNHGRGFFGDLMHGSVARRAARTGTHHIYFASSQSAESKE